MINIKFCMKCKKGFDIATNYEVCPECRGEKLNRVGELNEVKEDETRRES